MSNQPPVGSIGWNDLTVSDATGVNEFYKKVVGWEDEAVAVDDYHDFVIKSGGEAMAGICHARGANKDMPAQWLIYIAVADLEKSMVACESSGGKVLVPKRDMGGYGVMCVIQDPAGAVAALIQPPA